MKNLKKILIPIAIVVTGVLITGAIIYINKGKKATEFSEQPVLVQPETLPETPPSGKETETSLENFAKCLTEKGAKFYGAFWCGWCKKQKEIFGESAKYLPYVECIDSKTNQMTLECQNEQISGFPTWKLPDGTKTPGFKTPNDLAELSGCQL